MHNNSYNVKRSESKGLEMDEEKVERAKSELSSQPARVKIIVSICKQVIIVWLLTDIIYITKKKQI